ncbi:hypothetical protein NQ318_011409 [Aromia moschata]|uniref:Uncharacterized protein n=1 Tax=Aromia moschata TaxID=1265417 RepID=A0AAV8YT61_9CUCU|nr:hypothetical protein NQ318_011409 [Aromia moschata]
MRTIKTTRRRLKLSSSSPEDANVVGEIEKNVFILTNKDITYEIRTEIKRLGRPIPDLIISKTDCVGKGRHKATA